jgi:hypothetical protein
MNRLYLLVLGMALVVGGCAAAPLEVPTYTRNTGDTRDAIRPDIEMPLVSADFFAGKDPVLDAVLAGTGPESTP